MWGGDQKERRLGRVNSTNPAAKRVCSVGETAKCSWRTANWGARERGEEWRMWGIGTMRIVSCHYSELSFDSEYDGK